MSQGAEPYILFELAGTTYGLPTARIQHVEMLEHVTPVPSAPSFVDGVVFSRGQVVPAINLRARFGMPRQPHTARTRLIIVCLNDRLIGLIVDEAREFRTLPAAQIRPVDAAVARVSGEWLAATATLENRLILLPSLELVCELPAEMGQTKSMTTSGQPQLQEASLP